MVAILSKQATNELRLQGKQLLQDGRALAEKHQSERGSLPADIAIQVDKILDDAQKLFDDADRQERMYQMEFGVEGPRKSNHPAVFTPDPGNYQMVWQGKVLNDDQKARLMAQVPFKGFLSGVEAEAYNGYGAAFEAYIREGKGLMNQAQLKDLAAGTGVAGGYLVRDTWLTGLIVKQRERSVMRSICNVLPPVPSGSVITPTEDSVFSDATWTTEVKTGNRDEVLPFGERTLTPHALAKRVLISRVLMRTPTIDMEAYIRDRMAYKFAIPEEQAFINGNGSQQPLGLLSDTSVTAVTTATSLTVTGDDIIRWIYELPSSYAQTPDTYILTSRAFLRKVRQMKDGIGQYVWQPGIQNGMPNMIMDTRYVTSDRFDDGIDGATDAWEANAQIAVVGDFSNYWIVDALNMEIQMLDQLYAEYNQIGYIGRKETDGRVILPEAFRILKVKS